MRKFLIFGLLLSTILAAPETRATATTINFENLSDSTIIGSNYASLGVIFSGGAIAAAGFSLNDAEFPPHSGINVAIDPSGPITLSFTTPISSFSGFFTYAQTLTLTAFNAANQIIATATSLFGSNFVSSGKPPNELIQLNFSGSITRVTIAGNPNGGSFALDDLTFTRTAAPPVAPEPSTWSLMFIALVGGIVFRKLLLPRL